jgi:hypothetical protein
MMETPYAQGACWSASTCARQMEGHRPGGAIRRPCHSPQEPVGFCRYPLSLLALLREKPAAVVLIVPLEHHAGRSIWLCKRRSWQNVTRSLFDLPGPVLRIIRSGCVTYVTRIQ